MNATSLLLSAALALQAAPVPAAPPPAAPAPAPAPAPASAPASPEHASADNVLWMDARPLTPAIDSMRDVQPSRGVLVRCPGIVMKAEPALDVPAPHLSWRAEEDRVALVCKGAEDRTAVLGQLRWNGPSLEWEWARASAASYPDALAEIQRVLPWMTIRVTMMGDAKALVMSQPKVESRRLTQQSPVLLSVPAAVGRALVLGADDAAGWTRTVAAPNELRFACSTGSVRAAMDAAGRVRVEIEPPGGLVVADLRKQIADRMQEMHRVTPEEKKIIEAEVADLRAKLAKAEQLARVAVGPWPDFPPLRVRDAAGREFATIQVQMK